MRPTRRTPKLLVILTAVVLALGLAMPTNPANAEVSQIGAGEANFVQGEFGRARVNSVQNAKTIYEVGDVLSLYLRYESLLAVASNVVATSETVQGLSVCRWDNLPSSTTGKYNCGYGGTGPAQGNITYTITEADAQAGKATISTSWAWNADGDTDTIVHTSEVTVTQPTTSPTPTETSTGPTEPAPTPTVTVPADPRPLGEYTVLASAGDWNFSCHRIPALTQLPNGRILAAWDGRPGCGDSPNPNSILFSYSDDYGNTWSDAVNIAAGNQGTPKHGYSDPSFVTDHETGKVFLFFVKSFDAGFFDSVPGVTENLRNVAHAAVIESSDSGATWTTPKVITKDITNDEATWKSRFATSGEGIQLRYGDKAGRLMLNYPLRLTDNTIKAYTVYSDDHGVTWKAGNPVGDAMDENKVVELSDGTLMMNTRDNAGRGYRRIAYSTDQGINWGPVTQELQLPDPRNNASIIRVFPEAPMGSDQAKILAFSNAAVTAERYNGTVKISYDDGTTWVSKRIFEPGTMSYSTLTPLRNAAGEYDGTMGLLFEGQNNQIRYMTISLDWADPIHVDVNATGKALNRGTNQTSFTITNHGDAALTVTPEVTGPRFLEFSSLDDITIPAGGTEEVVVDVTVPHNVDPTTVRLEFAATVGEDSAGDWANFPIQLRPGQNVSEVLPGALTVVSEGIPAFPTDPISNTLDGNDDTMWHTPWGDGVPAVTLPLDIDFSLGEELVCR